MVIAGRYEVIRTLGRGTSGEVLLVRDRATGTICALKAVPRHERTDDVDTPVAKFKREFSLLQGMHHPHIARPLDFGSDATTGRLFFTQEYIEGEDLLTATRAADPSMIEQWIVQVLRALAFLHARGVVHGDLKPAHCLVERASGTVKVIDFGLAPLAGEWIAGTPAYLAPEVWLREARDGRADLYALGVLWYECLTGKNPFVADSSVECRRRHLREVAPPLSTTAPHAPTYLGPILARLLAKNPRHRYADAAVVIRDLNACGERAYPIETEQTGAAYLPDSGPPVGRAELWARLCELVSRAPSSDTVPRVLISGAAGLGKTRLAQELHYFAQLNECAVVIDDADGPRDTATLARLRERWLQPPADVHLLIVAATSEEMESLRTWAADDAAVTIVALAPFTRAEVGAYLQRVLGIEALPDDVVALFHAHSEGNPRWLRELVVAALQQRMFCDAYGRWSAAQIEDLRAEVRRLPLPAQVETWLEQRITQLPRTARDAVEWLALLGRPGVPASMEAAVGPRATWLPLLQQTGWIECCDEAIALVHPGVAPWVRRALPPDRRMAWHDRIRASNPSLTPLEQDYHCACGSDPAAALAAAHRYVECCARAESWDAAIEVLAWNWRVRPPGAACIRFGLRWLSTLIDAERSAAEVAAAVVEVETAIAALPAPEQPPLRLLLTLERIEGLLRRADWGAAQAAITAVLATADLPPVERVRLRNFLGRIALEQHDIATAEAILRETWALALDLPEGEWARVCNNDLGLVLLRRGEYAEARAVILTEMERIRRIGDRGLEARCDYNLGEAAGGMGDLAEATDRLSRAHLVAAEVGHHALVLRSLNALGNLQQRRGELSAALATYERALRVAQRVGDIGSAAAIGTNLGILLHQARRLTEAETHLRQAERWLRRDGHPATDDVVLARNLLEQAALDRATGDGESARRRLHESRALVERHAATALLPFIQTAMAAVSEDTVRRERHHTTEVTMAPDHSTTTIPTSATVLPSPRGDDKWRRLLDVNQQLARSTAIHPLLQTIVGHAVTMARAELGMILLLDDQDHWTVAAHCNVEPDAAMAQVSVTMARRAVAHGRPLLTDDAQQDGDWSATASVQLAQLRAVLCVPIHAAGKVLGVVYLSHRFQVAAFHDTDLDLLAAFADLAGVAIERARLLEAARTREAALAEALAARELELSQLEATRTAPGGGAYRLKDLASANPAMGRLFELTRKIMVTDLSVFVHGETGTGKEVIARLLHREHPTRAKGPFVAVSCGAIPKELMESELFGYRAGAFSGAVRDKPGLCEAAQGGTLFLDEVAELPLELQAKLLRVLQEREVRRLGETTTRTIDCRIVAASHRDLRAMVRAGTFREDLFYRLCQIQLDIPPLRERREDLPALVERFVRRVVGEGAAPTLERALWQRFMTYEWPGNVRELEHLLQALCALSDGRVLRCTDLPPHHPLAMSASTALSANSATTQEATPPQAKAPMPPAAIPPTSPATALSLPIDANNRYDTAMDWRTYEVVIARAALRHYQGDARRAARGLGISAAKLYRLIQQHDLRNPQHPLAGVAFRYREGERLSTYMAKIFAAALRAHGGRPYPTIRSLGVSAGYFYKVIPATARPEIIAASTA